MHAVHSVIEVLDALCSLGREEFERKGWLPVLMRLGEFLGYMHLDRAVVLEECVG